MPVVVSELPAAGSKWSVCHGLPQVACMNRDPQPADGSRKDVKMITIFTESLKIMGYGMLGIFVVAAVLILVMSLLTAIFPPEKEHE